MAQTESFSDRHEFRSHELREPADAADRSSIGVETVRNGLGGSTGGDDVMAQRESSSERTDKIPGMTPSGFAEMGKKSMEELARAQADLFGVLQETSRHWFHRMQSEGRLASEFAHEVTKAGTIPDAVAACREWTSRRLEMMVDDNKHLLDHSQKVMKTGAQLLSNGLFVGGQNGAGAATGEDRRP